MPNNHFEFKKFKIIQEKTSMKVGTDGVLLGAWVNCNENKKALDIGTGTGLIAIMLALKNKNLHIDAIEIDNDAYYQAIENVQNCPWKNRIDIHLQKFQEYVRITSEKYDLVVSNPPFF